ncbi:MAG: membrane protein insertase YidC [Verrucomicrobia bacterium]|nr:MAG: membrane protein insertase YidC [Verrucomicrobiota bacterium]
MDKKNTTIGVLLLVAAMAVLFYQQSTAPAPKPHEATGQSAAAEPAEASQVSAEAPAEALVPAGAETPEPMESDAGAAASALFETAADHLEGERIETLSNDYIEVRFTSRGGAIAEVVLKKYPAAKDSEDPYILNHLRAAPALSLLNFPGADAKAVYRLVEKTGDSITWALRVGDQMQIERTYWINDELTEDAEPYLIRHETVLRNLTGTPVNTPRLEFSLGTAEPVDAKDPGFYLNVGAYDGDDARFVGRNNFEPGFFKRTFGGDTQIKQELPVLQPCVWASVKNQFFTTVLTPDEPAQLATARRVEFPLLEGEAKPRIGVTGSLVLESQRVEPGQPVSLGFDFYAGPKEYKRLVKLGERQDLVMQFGFFGFFSKILLTLLTALHGVLGNWGLAIIATTLVIRTAMWPITATAAKSAKRMAKIQGPMKEIQEKYKDNRQKQQEEMLKLFKQHRINPLGGCLPMFIQIPIFFGLFSMLRSASELRFAEFLWIGDLSQPDTVATIYGFPINIMPLLMGISMVVQMRMTPTPSTDNASAKMMKFMPYMVTALCYNFSSGLAVYWTASNLFSIFQQWVTNRRKDPADELPADKPAGKKKAKNARGAVAPGIGAEPKLRRGLPVQKKKKKR